MTYKFSGPYGSQKKFGRPNKGVMRQVKEDRRDEAKNRNALTPVENRAIFRRLGVNEQAALLEAEQSMRYFVSPEDVEKYLKEIS